MIGSVALFVTVTTPAQLSVAVGFVKLVTSHTAVRSSSDAVSGTGAVTSAIMTFCVCVEVLPFPSSYVQVTTVVPWVLIGKHASCVTIIFEEQFSVAVGYASVVTSDKGQ